MSAVTRWSTTWALAEAWLDARGRSDDWFLHVNLWDVHVPYRSPTRDLGGDPVPAWARAAWAADLDNPGIRAPQRSLPMRKMGGPLATEDDLAALFIGYDDAVRSVDDAIARLIARFQALGIWRTWSSSSAPTMARTWGSVGYAGHATADAATANVPLIIRAPGRLGPV